jgi:hypothetical protein
MKSPLHPWTPPSSPNLCTMQILPLRSRVLNMKPRVTPPLLRKTVAGLHLTAVQVLAPDVTRTRTGQSPDDLNEL